MKKLFVLILVGTILYFDWKSLKELFREGADLEREYLKLFGSVSILSILLYFTDRQK